MTLRLSEPVEDLRILDFDIENRPLSYLGNDWTSGEITAIAWSWIGSGEVDVILLTRHGHFVDTIGEVYEPEEALGQFAEVLESADMVTGHYIRRHDLPMINAALMEVGHEPLETILVSDTKEDLTKRQYLSASQENLSAMLGIDAPKVHMNQAKWREANRLTDEGLRLTAERATGDVIQHMAMREELLRQRLLKAPRRWNP